MLFLREDYTYTVHTRANLGSETPRKRLKSNPLPTINGGSLRPTAISHLSLPPRHRVLIKHTRKVAPPRRPADEPLYRPQVRRPAHSFRSSIPTGSDPVTMCRRRPSSEPRSRGAITIFGHPYLSLSARQLRPHSSASALGELLTSVNRVCLSVCFHLIAGELRTLPTHFLGQLIETEA